MKRDGTITARKVWLAIDNGAYTADAGFFSQLAAMHALGPYQVPHAFAEAHLVYTNHQPSGSVRAPTAPQTCWALESHTDEVAKALDAARATLEKHGDLLNAAHARYLQVRRLLLVGRLDEAERTLAEIWQRVCGDAPPNLMKLTFHPEGLRPYIKNMDELGPGLLARAIREARESEAAAAVLARQAGIAER